MTTSRIILLGLLAISRCSYAGSLDTWSSQISGTTNNLNAIAYASPTFMAVGNGGTILSSTNGADWVSQNSGTTNNLYGIVYANGIFVAVGQGPIRTSADGVNWSGHSAPLSTLYGITYGDGLFVAVGANGNIGTSTNGTNWVAQNSGTTATLHAITYADGMFAGVGSVGTVILTSINGTNWINVNTTGNLVPGLNGIAFGGNKFATVGGNSPVAPGGSIETSPDGNTWSIQKSGIDMENFYGIAWGNSSFVAVGGLNADGFWGGGTNRIIFTSTDAYSWINRLADTNGLLNSVIYGNGSFVAVGLNGAILQSGPIFTLAGKNQFTNGGFELDLTGETGRTYRIQKTTNLTDTNWTDLTNFTSTAETIQFLDVDATNYPAGYYRAVSP